MSSLLLCEPKCISGPPKRRYATLLSLIQFLANHWFEVADPLLLRPRCAAEIPEAMFTVLCPVGRARYFTFGSKSNLRVTKA